MKKGSVRALVAGALVVELVAATAAIARVGSLPPKCSTELIAACGNSIGCLQAEVAKVKAYCRKALLEGVPPLATRPD